MIKMKMRGTCLQLHSLSLTIVQVQKNLVNIRSNLTYLLNYTNSDQTNDKECKRNNRKPSSSSKVLKLTKVNGSTMLYILIKRGEN